MEMEFAMNWKLEVARIQARAILMAMQRTTMTAANTAHAPGARLNRHATTAQPQSSRHLPIAFFQWTDMIVMGLA
jgi:hypothetical protein